MKTTTIATTLIIVIFLLMISVVSVYTRAQDPVTATTTTAVLNESPLVDTLNFSSSAYGTNDLSPAFVPLMDAYRTINITGRIIDQNGDTDIDTVTALFYRSGVTDSCTEDENDCYRTITCTIDQPYGGTTEALYNCPVSIAYWADATDTGGRYPDETWTALITVSDVSATTGTLTDTIEINSLLALNLPDAIDYGNRSLNEESSNTNNIETIITQKGNTPADVHVYGSSMSCTIGTLPIQNQSWSLTDVDYQSATVLSGVSSSTNIHILYKDNDTQELESSLFWNIKVPATGVKGVCIGANTLSIVAYTPEEGSLIDARLENVRYTGTKTNGYTTATGGFRYYPNDTLTFSIGAVTLGSINTNNIQSDKKVVLPELFSISTRSELNDTRVVNLARFLQTLDEDDNNGNGIKIPASAHLLTQNITWATVDEATLSSSTGKTLVGTQTAKNNLASSYVAENITSYDSPTLTLEASDIAIASGQSTTLTWSSTNTNNCSASNGWSGDKATSGTQSSGSLTASTTFTLTCTGYGGQVSQSVAVSVVEFASISAGGSFSSVRTSNGSLWVWGSNRYGQLGNTTNNGTTSPNPTPTQIAETWTSVSAGGNHTLAIKSNGTLWAWGYNAYGQLGNSTNNGTINPNPTPTQIAGTWTSVSGGTYHSLGIKSDGTLWAWGYGVNGELGFTAGAGPNPTPTQIAGTWTSVSAGAGHTLAIKSDGTLWAWGSNDYGQLGRTGESSSTPTQIAGTWTSVSGGYLYTLALKSDGTLWAWGRNIYGQLGNTTNNNTNNPNPTPTQIAGTWTSVSAGYYHTLALKSDGTLWAWGGNQYGQLGNNTNSGTENPNPTPTQIAGTWTSVSGGYLYTLALKSDGTLWAWGHNNYGQLGNTTNNTTNNPNPTPTQISTALFAMDTSDRYAMSTESMITNKSSELREPTFSAPIPSPFARLLSLRN